MIWLISGRFWCSKTTLWLMISSTWSKKLRKIFTLLLLVYSTETRVRAIYANGRLPQSSTQWTISHPQKWVNLCKSASAYIIVYPWSLNGTPYFNSMNADDCWRFHTLQKIFHTLLICKKLSAALRAGFVSVTITYIDTWETLTMITPVTFD